MGTAPTLVWDSKILQQCQTWVEEVNESEQEKKKK